MSTTMVASEVKAVPLVISSIQDIPLGKIRKSKSNPRRFFDDAKLAELAAFVPRNKSPLYGHWARLMRWRLSTVIGSR